MTAELSAQLMWVSSDWRRKDALESITSRPWLWLGGMGALFLKQILPLLWSQYSLLWRDGLPPADLGAPLYGGTSSVIKQGLVDYFNELRKRHMPFIAVSHFMFFQPVIVISHEIWQRKVTKLENEGLTVPCFSKKVTNLLGKNSLICMAAGKGHLHHARLRMKCQRALAPKVVLSNIDVFRAMFRKEFETIAKSTEGDGFVRFVPIAHRIAFNVSATSIIGDGNERECDEMRKHFGTYCRGMATPRAWDLGRHSVYGRALIARAEIAQLIAELLAKPSVERTALGELKISSADCGGLTEDEIVDSVLTLLFAGQLATMHSMTQLLVDLASRPAEVAKVRAEANRTPESILEDSATLRLVVESMRRQPPAHPLTRICKSQDIHLNNSIKIPKGFRYAPMLQDDFDGDIDTTRKDFDNREFLRDACERPFGGNHPHSCVGRHSVLLMLQTFARELYGHYDVEVVEAVPQPKAGHPAWKGDLPLRLRRRT